MKIWAILGHFWTFFQHFFKNCFAISTFSVGFASFKNKKISPIYEGHIGVNFTKIALKLRIWQPFEKCLIFMIFPIFSVFSAFLWNDVARPPILVGFANFLKKTIIPIYDGHIGVEFAKIASEIRISQPFEKCLIFVISANFGLFQHSFKKLFKIDKFCQICSFW